MYIAVTYTIGQLTLAGGGPDCRSLPDLRFALSNAKHKIRIAEGDW